MQFTRSTTTVALLLFLGAIVPSYSQQDRQKERQGKREKQQQGRQQQAQQQRPQAQGQERRGQPSQQPQRQQRAQQPQQQRAQQQRQQQPQQQQRSPRQQTQQRPQQQQQQRQNQGQPQRTQRQALAWQQQRGWEQHGAWQGGSNWQQGRAQKWQNQHRSWAQRGGYGGYYIPQARFNMYFGSQHWFRMRSRPTMYMGYPRFAYGGFSFMLLDPWPEYWADNWYDTDDLYIDYDDGYYLYNRRAPYVRLAISVVL